MKSWLKKEEFIVCRNNDWNGYGYSHALYLCISDGTKTSFSRNIMIGDKKPYLMCKYYMTPEDLGLIDLSVDDISIKGYCILGADNQLNIESTTVITEDEGWFLEEEFSVEVVPLSNLNQK